MNNMNNKIKALRLEIRALLNVNPQSPCQPPELADKLCELAVLEECRDKRIIRGRR